MALEVKHVFQSAKGDGPDPTLVQPSDWNALHSMTMEPGLVGNSTTSAGPATVVPIGAGLKFTSGALESTLKKLPVGVVLPLAGNYEPPGWLICDGRAVSRTTYAVLYSITQDKFGSGNGSTTFNIPDMRGRVPAGKDNLGGTAANRLTIATFPTGAVDVGKTAGTERVTLTEAQLASHDHVLTGAAHRHFAATVGMPATTTPEKVTSETSMGRENRTSAAIAYDLAGHIAEPTVALTSIAGAGAGINDAGSDEPHLNLQPTITMNYVIFTDVYP